MENDRRFVNEPSYPYEPAAGATLTEHQIVGRDALVKHCWRDLRAGSSLLLLAPRRVGKTSICTLLESRQPEGYVVCRADVERCTTGAKFVERTAEVANAGLGRGRTHRIATAAKRAAAKIKKIKLSEVEVNVDSSLDLENALASLLGALERSCEALDIRLVLVWDEFPLFIDTLVDRGDHESAITILSGLRAHRQQHPTSRLRMVCTGSIGFFEVVERLREVAKYSGEPINDMMSVDIPLLDERAARELVGTVLWRMERPGVRERRFVHAAARACEGHPYVIQWLATRLWRVGTEEPLDVGDIDKLLTELLAGDTDPLDLGHYLTRLNRHGWGGDARDVLDVLASRGAQGATLDQLDNVLSKVERRRISEALHRLRRDGYVVDEGGGSRFRLLLLARWWERRRGEAIP